MRPSKAWIITRVEVDMDNWDDDVNWADPIAVINDQIDCVGLREACNTQEHQIEKIVCQFDEVTYTMTHNKEVKK